MQLQSTLSYLQIALTAMNILILAYAFLRFLSKPHTDLEDRVAGLEAKYREIEGSLRQGNDRFRAQGDTTDVLITCMMALIDFELAFCATSNYSKTKDLEKAQEDLRQHLSKRKTLDWI